MNKKWSEMTQDQKKKFIWVCIYVAIALVAAVLDITGVWANALCHYMVAAYFLVEGVLTWKKSRNMAILDIVLAIVLLLGIF